MQIVERPYNINYSLNDIRYVFQLDQLQRPGLKLQVKLLTRPVNSGSFEELTTFLLTPASDGSIYLYLQEYINSKLSYVLPAFSNLVFFTNADKQACAFTIQYRELTDTDIVAPAWNTEESYFNLYAIKGGIEKHLYSRNNFFKFFEAQKPFLTWQPSGRFIDKNETAYLTFLNPNYSTANLTQLFSLCCKITDVNGEEEVNQVAFTTTGLLVHVCINLAALNTSLDFNQLYKIELGVIPTGNAAAYNYTYYFDYRPAYKYYDLLFNNSLSGVDFIRVKGPVTESFDRTLTDASGGMDVLDMFANYKAEEAMYAGITLQKKYKGDVGYLYMKKAQYALMELLVSSRIYMRDPFRWVPVVALQKSQDLGTAVSSLNSFPIEWALSESNEVYTPESLLLNSGDSSMLQAMPPPACPVVNNLQLSIRQADSMLMATFVQFTSEQLSSLVVSIYTKLIVNGDPISDWIAYNPSSGSTFEILNVISGNSYALDYKTICHQNESVINRTNTVQLQIQNPASITLISNTGTPGGTRTEVFEIGDNMNVGDQYYLEVYSHQVSVTVVSGDTPTSIAAKLATAVNNTTAAQWNEVGSAPATGTAGFPPSATANGAQISVVLNDTNQFAAGVIHP